MKIWTWAIALLLATTGLAAAQAPPPPPPGGEGATGGAETPPPPPNNPPPNNPPPMPPMTHDEPAADTGRPTELAFGIGFGYTFPTSLQTPNTTSVRLRLPSGLTFEPQLVLATASTVVDTGMSVTNKETDLTIGALLRYPLKSHGKVDLEFLGSLLLENDITDPDGDNNNKTVTTISLGYGIACSYWFNPHWNLSLSGGNPLIAYTRTRQEMGPDTVTVNKTTTIGLVFEPTITLMLHLYN